jgi:hypothetical protein
LEKGGFCLKGSGNLFFVAGWLQTDKGKVIFETARQPYGCLD